MPQDPGSQKNQNPKLIESIAFSFLSINRIGSKQGILFFNMNLPTPKMFGASLLCILFFTSGCVSTLMRVVRDPLQSSSNSYPSVRMAGDSLKHPDILKPLILLDLPFQPHWIQWCYPLIPPMLSDWKNIIHLCKHDPLILCDGPLFITSKKAPSNAFPASAQRDLILYILQRPCWIRLYFLIA